MQTFYLFYSSWVCKSGQNNKKCSPLTLPAILQRRWAGVLTNLFLSTNQWVAARHLFFSLHCDGATFSRTVHLSLDLWWSSLCCALLSQHGFQLTLCCCCGCTWLSSLRSISEETKHTIQKITKSYGHLSKLILVMSRRAKWVDAQIAIDFLLLSAAACDLLGSVLSLRLAGVGNAPMMVTVSPGDDSLWQDSYTYPQTQPWLFKSRDADWEAATGAGCGALLPRPLKQTSSQ